MAMRKHRFRVLIACGLAGLLGTASAACVSESDHTDIEAEANTYRENSKQSPLAPTLADIRYGEHERLTLDFWQAESELPTPLVLIIHGGGWTSGDKANVPRRNTFPNIRELLGNGISVAAINYRLIGKHTDGVVPPVKAPLHDAARALQFIRSKAGEWNIDKQRIGATGVSAGACSSLWLAFHDDLADPQSEDPVARESTRLWCASGSGAQTTLDPEQMKEWFGEAASYGGHAFGIKDFAEFLAARESILPWIAEYSPYALVSGGDPPVCLFYSGEPPALGIPSDAVHGANFGVGLKRRCDETGVGCQIVYNGASDVKYKRPLDYLVETLKAPDASGAVNDNASR